jgi:hypothetical protein
VRKLFFCFVKLIIGCFFLSYKIVLVIIVVKFVGRAVLQWLGLTLSERNWFFFLLFQQNDRVDDQQKSVQQQPDFWFSTGRPLVSIRTFRFSDALDGGPTRFLISAAMVMKACSTLVAFLADVSRNGMPNWLAYSCGQIRYWISCLLREIGLDLQLTVATVVSTTFFVCRSHLLPTSSLLTFSHA